MNNILQVHDAEIEVLSPIHIGSGVKINKKEYVYNDISKKVHVVDLSKLYEHFCKLHREGAITEFLLNKNIPLSQFMKNYSFNIEYFTKYSLDSSLQSAESLKNHEINSFIKDPYGFPYVPGSSIKGMIRSALIAYRIFQNNSYLHELQQELETELEKELERNYSKKNSRANKKCLGGLVNKRIESVFDKKISDKESLKLFSGLIVSDSRPIMEKDSLILAQKVDYSLKGNKSFLPIYKESLRPETKIRFTITIDRSLLPISIDNIKEALDFYQNLAYEYFYKKYGRGDNSKGIVWLGGGAGFTSKTVIYQLFSENAHSITNKILECTLGEKIYEMHNHDKYVRDVSPHMCKCTMYSGNLYDVGKGRINFFN